ncbi:MAG: transposase [Actinoallomurus sp.]
MWAVEGCNGIGKHIAHRLVHDGETVVDVPAKLSAQVRVFATGNGRKTDPVDAHSVAMVALRTPNLVRIEVDPDLVVLGMLVDRRDELGRTRTQTINRLHRLLLELFPGGAGRQADSDWPAYATADPLPTQQPPATTDRRGGQSRTPGHLRRRTHPLLPPRPWPPPPACTDPGSGRTSRPDHPHRPSAKLRRTPEAYERKRGFLIGLGIPASFLPDRAATAATRPAARPPMTDSISRAPNEAVGRRPAVGWSMSRRWLVGTATSGGRGRIDRRSHGHRSHTFLYAYDTDAVVELPGLGGQRSAGGAIVTT